MGYQYVFRRYEIKYWLDRRQYDEMCKRMENYMQPDGYGHSTVCNVYMDTPDYRLIRRSLEGPPYKEKMRVRSYGVARSDTPVFIELKKKYEGVVYKRRVSVPYAVAQEYWAHRAPPQDTQIWREIEAFTAHYRFLRPTVFLSYEREAFYARDDDAFRITFDDNIRWREADVSLSVPPFGRALVPPDRVLMEVKTATALPLWLTSFLAREHLYKTSFSKYGTVYQYMQGGIGHVGNGFQRNF